MKRLSLSSSASIRFTFATLAIITTGGLVACGAPPGQGSSTENSQASAATSSEPQATSTPAPAASQGKQAPSKARPMIVGGGGPEYTLRAPAGTGIYNVTGSFPSVSVGTESDTGAGVNAYGLQVNTNTFYISPAFCENHPPASQENLCVGWEQFNYVVSGGEGQVFIEYWLLDTGVTTCPTGGWQFKPQTQDDGSIVDDCVLFTPSVPAPVVLPSGLGSVSLTGSVSTSYDMVSFSTGTGAPATSTGSDVFSLATGGYGSGGVGGVGGWTIAEFNVFGFGFGSQANFSIFSSLTVNINAQYGSTSSNLSVAPPTCGDVSLTGETNNMTLGACTPAAGQWIFLSGAARMWREPSISFTEETFLQHIGPIRE